MSTKKNIADQEIIIKDSLFEFVKTNIPDADLTLIDEIVLSYVVAILEDVSSDPVFDVEGFCEMMSAYFPEFESINHATVCNWMFELEAKLRADEPQDKDISLLELSLPEILPIAKPRSHNNSESCEEPKRVHKISEVSDGGSDSSFCDFTEEIDTLQDMFPHVCALEIKHCLTIASGDLERGTQILLHRQEHGQSITNNSSLTLHISSSKAPVIDDNELKNRIIERYSYIDQDALAREHRPVAPKVEPKKLVRYRDNKIVSLKGERYTEVKKGDDVEDVSLKKSKKQQHCP
ncbi:PREDICTED: CUE domain-containing protein 2 [Nicrophorus vespilloides]|uniref:CUE domain-containing protein 2 n=1 Tax=Nicrophorus vespilloides TaxID=110193 RepID=A0ABM1N252_NICVS|nr:PREDICTED: CUE domain-containing protein 2 [Nicrophorus vespilloides]XP_017780902.1 PREDICTED: CUE domain-containing protein 2 [Nicrophorus vespilloides]